MALSLNRKEDWIGLVQIIWNISVKYAQFEKKMTNYSFMYNASQFKSIFKDCWLV